MPKIYFIVHTIRTEQLVKDVWQDLLCSMEPSQQALYKLKIFNYCTHASLDSIPNDGDIYIGRGQVAEYFRKKNPDFVVLSVPFTILNIIETLQCINTIPREQIKAVLISSMHSENLETVVKNTLNIKLTVHSMPFFVNPHHKYQQLKELIFNFYTEGYNVFLGGFSVRDIAKEMGLCGIYVDFSIEGIESILQQAINISNIRRIDREKAARFQTLLNHEDEGIIITAADSRIIYINNYASNYLDINSESWIGIPISHLKDRFSSSTQLIDDDNIVKELIEIDNTSYFCTKIPCFLQNEKIGEMLTFKKVQDMQQSEIKSRIKLYQKGLQSRYSFDNIKGANPSLLSAIQKAKTFARVDSNVLIAGQTGTGKELFAQSIHSDSERKHQPFIAVNCAAIPFNLMESEFFGYTAGAFTGASREGKEGYFELANRGTLFLDEISELHPSMQGRLLRVISEKEIMRIGGNKVIPIDVRIICATNRDLKQMVKEGTFREDLFYRLKVLTLPIPSLKERDTDILILTEHYINHFSEKLDRPIPTLSDKMKKILLQYPWPGNIRELRNLCEQIVVLGDEAIIESELLSSSVSSTPLSQSVPSNETSEKEKIYRALLACKFNKTETARLLQINRTTLWKKLKEYELG